MRSLRLSTRAALCFLAITLLLLISSIFSGWSLKQLRESELDVETNWMASISQTAKIDAIILRLRLETLRVVSVNDPAIKQQSLDMIASSRLLMLKNVADYAALIASADERKLFQTIEAQAKDYESKLDEITQIAKTGTPAEGISFINNTIRPLTNDLQQSVLQLTQWNQEGAKEAGVNAGEIYATAITMLVVSSVIAVLLTVMLAILFTRSLLRPLRELMTVSQTIADGDLRVEIIPNGRDELTELMKTTALMQSNLRDTIRHIGESSTQLASAAEEMTAVSDEASRGLQRQNEEVEQAATAVNEMTAAVEEVARNASSASASARESETSTRLGSERVNQTVAAIRGLADTVEGTSGDVLRLAEQTQNIARVLDVIRTIAEQTNLLALNAAIEAARAGEQGRGFAVVADEVRALAHRTQESTREIEQMIGGIQAGSTQAVQAMELSQQEANSTLSIANEAGAALEEIARAITDINERNFMIATASEQQAQVARSVDHNLMSIRDLSIQTSSGAQQSASASQEVSRLAVDMHRLVQRFKV
jgi:methyl-accepting chemotaxis protein